MQSSIRDLSVQRRLMDGLERSYVNSKLNAWGRWMERHWEESGYPRWDSVAGVLNGAGGSAPSSRVLCLEKPEPIALTHLAVLKLPEPERLAVTVYYVFRVNSDGQLLDLRTKCDVGALDYNQMRKDLGRARYHFLGLEAPY